jgi:hypothetical protein
MRRGTFFLDFHAMPSVGLRIHSGNKSNDFAITIADLKTNSRRAVFCSLFF